VKNKNKERTMKTLSVLQLLKLLSSANFAPASPAPSSPVSPSASPPADTPVDTPVDTPQGEKSPASAQDVPPMPEFSAPTTSSKALESFYARHDSAIRHAEKK
jgi:hypothetical protein